MGGGLEMFAPFSTRHREAFNKEPILSITSEIDESNLNRLKDFTKKCINYVSSEVTDEEIRDLALDAAICVRDFKTVLKLTENFAKTEYFLYRAYAYSRLNMTNKIVSLKLRFHQKYTETLEHPRNAFIITSMEFLLLYGEQNYNMSIATLEELEELLEKYPEELENKLFTLLMLTLGAQTFLQINNFDKVEEIARKILKSALTMEDPYFQSVALNLITTVLINKGEFRKAQNMLNATLIPTEKTGLAADRASLLNNSAKLELARGDFEKSARLLEQIYELIKHNSKAKAITAVNISELYIFLDSREKAKEFLEVAIKLDKENNLKLIEPYILSTWLNIENNNLEEAQSFLDESEERLEQTGELRKKPHICFYKGLLALKKEDTNEAIKCFEICYEAAAQYNNIELLIKSQLQLATIFLERFNESRELSDFSQVLRYIDNLTYLSKDQFIPRLMADLHMLKGTILLLGEKREKAIESIANALKIAENFRYKSIQREASSLLKKIETEHLTTMEEMKELENKGFLDIEKMFDVLQKYQGFKFIKTPKKVQTHIKGLAIVEMESATIKFKHSLEEDLENDTSLIPTVVAAVNLFSKNVLEEDLILNEIKEEGKELLVERISDYILVVIADKITFSLKMQFEQLVDDLKSKSNTLFPLSDDYDTQTKLLEIVNKYFGRTKEEKIATQEKTLEQEKKSFEKEQPLLDTSLPDSSLKEEEEVEEEKEIIGEETLLQLETTKKAEEEKETQQENSLEEIPDTESAIKKEELEFEEIETITSSKETIKEGTKEELKKEEKKKLGQQEGEPEIPPTQKNDEKETVLEEQNEIDD